jgi:hypothetical protein
MQFTNEKQLMQSVTAMKGMYSLDGDAMNDLCAYKLTSAQKFVPYNLTTQKPKIKGTKMTVIIKIDILTALGTGGLITRDLADLANKNQPEWYYEIDQKILRYNQQQHIYLQITTTKSWIRPGLAR